MIVKSEAGHLFGPFAAVDVQEDRLACDGTDLCFSVIGAYEIIETDPPGQADKFSWDGTQYVALAMPAGELSALVAAFILKVDADVDAIYAAAIGNRTTEYTLAEEDAQAYKTAGYAGTVPASVQAWATAKSATATWSADDILATATAWRGAQATIRAARLLRKEEARVAADVGALAVIEAAWAGFVVAIRTSLGIA
jgi:hypothetical protein